jgi:hypothetical protein
VGSFFVACGDGDGSPKTTCSPRKVTCLNDKTGEICSSDGSVTLPFTCDEGEVCGTSEEQTGCIGSCKPGEKECASEAISRVCAADGKAFIPVACAPGTGCDNDPADDDINNPTFGTCVRTDDPTVTVCDPEEVTCADDHTVKACEHDGSNWVYAPCAANELCADGECAVDPDKRCTPNTGTCVDATHVRKCADDGLSYEESEACPGETTCSDGACRGPVCTVDEVRCDDVRDGNVFTALSEGSYEPRAVYRCKEGVAWEVTECAQSDVCAYTDISSTAVNRYIEDLKTAWALGSSDLPIFDVPESSRATCQTPECAAPFALRELLRDGQYEDEAFFGSYACGDPTASDPSFIGSFSLCEGLPPYDNLHWANYECPDDTECAYVENVAQPNGAAQAPVCQGTCTSGDVRCFDEQGESTITCVVGEWDLTTVERCVSGTREQWCRRSLSGTANTTQASCQDPACVVWQEEFGTFLVPPGYGACGDDGLFYACLPDGTMAEGQACPGCVRSVIRAPGIAPPSQEPSHFAGYQPGYCVDECLDEEQMCVSIGSSTSSPSPFYYQCDNGHWTTIASCPDGEACRDVPRTAESRREIFCGGDCFPGETACVDEQGAPGGELFSICDDTGEWGEPSLCESGICSEDDQRASGRAACEDECIPGTKGCEDGGEVSCGDEARYGEPRACGAGMACFPGNPALSRFGCIECLPPDPTNPGQIPDSRCSGDTLEICGPVGTWSEMSATTCSAGCTGSQAGKTTPGEARAACLPTGDGGRAGGGQSGGGAGGMPGGAGSGGAGSGGAGSGGLGGQLG